MNVVRYFEFTKSVINAHVRETQNLGLPVWMFSRAQLFRRACAVRNKDSGLKRNVCACVKSYEKLHKWPAGIFLGKRTQFYEYMKKYGKISLPLMAWPNRKKGKILCPYQNHQSPLLDKLRTLPQRCAEMTISVLVLHSNWGFNIPCIY